MCLCICCDVKSAYRLLLGMHINLILFIRLFCLKNRSGLLQLGYNTRLLHLPTGIKFASSCITSFSGIMYKETSEQQGLLGNGLVWEKSAKATRSVSDHTWFLAHGCIAQCVHNISLCVRVLMAVNGNIHVSRRYEWAGKYPTQKFLRTMKAQ